MRLGQLYLLLATTLLLCNAAIAPLTSASNSTYIDIPIDLTSNENSTLQTEIYGSFIALNESNPFDIAPNLAAAFLREYSDGSREFYLYVDTVDASGNTHEYVGVVSVNDNDTVFTVISFVEIQVANTPSSSSANATTLAAFIDGFASGYSKYTQSQIDQDTYLAVVEKNIQYSFPLVETATVAAVYTKTEGLGTAYLIFYVGSAKSPISLWRASAVNDKKTTFIAAFDKIVVPSSITN